MWVSDSYTAVGINTQETEQQDREPKERRASITEKWQWNTYYGHNAKHHAYVYGKME